MIKLLNIKLNSKWTQNIHLLCPNDTLQQQVKHFFSVLLLFLKGQITPGGHWALLNCSQLSSLSFSRSSQDSFIGQRWKLSSSGEEMTKDSGVGRAELIRIDCVHLIWVWSQIYRAQWVNTPVKCPTSTKSINLCQGGPLCTELSVLLIALALRAEGSNTFQVNWKWTQVIFLIFLNVYFDIFILTTWW